MSYADRAKAYRASFSSRPAEGQYKTRLKGVKWELGRTSRKPQFVCEFKVIEGPTPEATAAFNQPGKDKKLKCRFLPHSENSFARLLVFLEDMGADLSQVRDETQDPDMMDLRNLMDLADKYSPDCVVDIKHQLDNDQYYNLYIREVEKVLVGNQTAAPAAPAPAAAPAAAPAPVWGYYMNGGAVCPGTREEIQNWVNAGYTGQVNVNGAWVSIAEAGLVVPAPAPVATPAPATPVEAAPAAAPAPAPVETAPAAAPAAAAAAPAGRPW